MTCVSSKECMDCGVRVVCDSSGKSGRREGAVRYVWGPCCCLLWDCPECGGRLKSDLPPCEPIGIPLELVPFVQPRQPDKVESALLAALEAHRQGKSVWFRLCIMDEQGSTHHVCEPSDFGELNVLERFVSKEDKNGG